MRRALAFSPLLHKTDWNRWGRKVNACDLFSVGLSWSHLEWNEACSKGSSGRPLRFPFIWWDFFFTLSNTSVLSGGKWLISLDRNNGLHMYRANFSNFICAKPLNDISSAPATVYTSGECGQSSEVSSTMRRLSWFQ